MQENPAIRTSFDKLNKKNLLNSDKDQLELAQFRILQNNIVYSNIVYSVKCKNININLYININIKININVMAKLFTD